MKKRIAEQKDQLAFLHYKMWYFKTAVEAGTEKIHYTKTAEGMRVDLDINEQYQHALAQCHDIGQLIELQNKAPHEDDSVAGDQK